MVRERMFPVIKDTYSYRDKYNSKSWRKELSELFFVSGLTRKSEVLLDEGRSGGRTNYPEDL